MYFGRWMERRRETRKRVVQTHEGMIISVFYVTSLTRLLSPQTHRRWNIDLLLFHPRGMLRAFVFTSREISNDSSGRRFLYRLVEISFGGFFFFYLYPKFMDNINSTTRSRFRERDGLPLIRRINSGERRIFRFSFSSKDSFGTISKFIVIRGQSFHLDTIMLYFPAVNQLNLLSWIYPIQDTCTNWRLISGFGGGAKAS